MNTSGPQLQPDIAQLLDQAAWVRGLVHQLVRDPAWREDVEQDAWLALLAARPAAVENLRGWCARVVQNALHQRARAEGRRAHRDRAAARDEALPGVDTLTEQAELQRRVVQAVLEVDAPLREALLLRYFHELPAAEIARRKGCPASTIRDRLQRGRDELRGRLEDEFPERSGRLRALALLLARGPRATLPRAVVATGAVVLLAAAGTALWVRGGAPGEAALEAPLAPLAALEDGSETLAAAPVRDAGRARPGPTPAPDATAELHVPVAATAPPFGRVVDDTGQPIADALVTVARVPSYSTSPRSIGVETRTDGDGEFQLPPSFASRLGLVLVAERAGFAPEIASLERGVQLVLERAVELRLLARWRQGGAPVAGAVFTAGEFDWTGGEQRCAVADVDGVVTFERAPAGRTLYARMAAPGHIFQPLQLDVPALGPYVTECWLERGSELRVVVEEDGAAFPGAEIVVEFEAVGRTGADGTLELGGVTSTDGSWALEVRHPTLAPTLWRPGPGDLPRADALHLPVFCGCAVSGVVRDAGGNPVPFARVRLASEGDEDGVPAPPFELPPGVRLASQFSGTRAARADAGGRYELTRIAPWTRWSGVLAEDPRTGRVARSNAPQPLLFDAPGAAHALDVQFPQGESRVSGAVLVDGRGAALGGRWSTHRESGAFSSAEDGSYELLGLEAGTLSLELELPAQGREHAEQIEVPAGEALRYDVRITAPGMRLAGRVVSEQGAPLAGVRLSAFDEARPGSNVRTSSGADGSFELRLESAPGAPLTLLVQHGPLIVSHHPVPAGTDDHEVVLPSLVAVELVTVERTGVSVSFRRAGERAFTDVPEYAVKDLGEGRHRTLLPVGRVDVRVGFPGSDRAEVELAGVEVAAGSPALIVGS